VIFAQFEEPDRITVFLDSVHKGSALAAEANCDLLEKKCLTDTILAHELFHVLEDRHADVMYTRTERVELWRKPFSNKSRLVCLSEIAAMAFARQLLSLPCSPYVLDVLLVYAYDHAAAWNLYDEIVTLTGCPDCPE